VSELIVETSAGKPAPGFRHDTADLVSFLSFVAAERYGSTHPLSVLANRLRRRHRIDLGPLWEFYEADAEDEQDRAQLERIWQAPGPVAQAAAEAAAALQADPDAAALAAGFPHLGGLLEDLAANARWAQSRGARLRLTYRL
jgi:hypothetical protein